MKKYTSRKAKSRTCTRCGTKFPNTTDYFRKKSDRPGLFAWCKKCHAKITATTADRWNREHRDRANENNRNYYKTHKQVYLTNTHRRRARQLAAEGSFTAADIERQRTAQKSRCYYCGKKRKLTIEHLVPLVRGGTNFPSNIVLACGSCNSKKHDKLPHEFTEGGRLL